MLWPILYIAIRNFLRQIKHRWRTFIEIPFKWVLPLSTRTLTAVFKQQTVSCTNPLLNYANTNPNTFIFKDITVPRSQFLEWIPIWMVNILTSTYKRTHILPGHNPFVLTEDVDHERSEDDHPAPASVWGRGHGRDLLVFLAFVFHVPLPGRYFVLWDRHDWGVWETGSGGKVLSRACWTGLWFSFHATKG